MTTTESLVDNGATAEAPLGAPEAPPMITIDHRHNGPAASAHGGIAAGRFAELVDSQASSVRLHAPVPLATPMRWLTVDNTATVYAGDQQLATVRPLSAGLPVGQFGRLAQADVAAAEAAWLDDRCGVHIAPTCFACGHERTEGGLGLRPGPITETSLFATSWRPEMDQNIPSWLIWAALDCPTGSPALAELGPTKAAVTGELAVEILEVVPGRGDYQLISRCTGIQGRKVTAEAALVNEQGRALAVATATWIAVPLRPAATGAPSTIEVSTSPPARLKPA
jgi:hypothetical protein